MRLFLVNVFDKFYIRDTLRCVRYSFDFHCNTLHKRYDYFKNSLIIHEQNTKKIIAVKESLYVIKHT